MARAHMHRGEIAGRRVVRTSISANWGRPEVSEAPSVIARQFWGADQKQLVSTNAAGYHFGTANGGQFDDFVRRASYLIFRMPVRAQIDMRQVEQERGFPMLGFLDAKTSNIDAARRRDAVACGPKRSRTGWRSIKLRLC